MKTGKQKLLMLGLDAALPALILKFAQEGAMPVTRKLMDRGWFSPMMTTFPLSRLTAFCSVRAWIRLPVVDQPGSSSAG